MLLLLALLDVLLERFVVDVAVAAAAGAAAAGGVAVAVPVAAADRRLFAGARVSSDGATQQNSSHE